MNPASWLPLAAAVGVSSRNLGPTPVIPVDTEVKLKRNQKWHIITKVHFQTADHDVAAVGSLPLEEDIASIYKVNDLFYNNKFDEVMEVTAVQ